MYIPEAFREQNPDTLAAFMRRHSFATLVTHDGAAPYASHLPVLFHSGNGEHGVLVSHMARANPQWRHFSSGAEVLAIFPGPHSYISPSWYETSPAVPTWNYAVVHAYGVPVILEDPERVKALLQETVDVYEAQFEKPWAGEMPEEFRDRLMKGIVAFEIPISRIEGKFKLGQNRPEEDQRGVFEKLRNSSDQDARALADLMPIHPKD